MQQNTCGHSLQVSLRTTLYVLIAVQSNCSALQSVDYMQSAVPYSYYLNVEYLYRVILKPLNNTQHHIMSNVYRFNTIQSSRIHFMVCITWSFHEDVGDSHEAERRSIIQNIVFIEDFSHRNVLSLKKARSWGCPLLSSKICHREVWASWFLSIKLIFERCFD